MKYVHSLFLCSAPLTETELQLQLQLEIEQG